MNEGRIQEFFNEQFGNVRSFIDEHDVIWFVGKDIATILQYNEPSVIISRYIKDKHKKILKAKDLSKTFEVAKIAISKKSNKGGAKRITFIDESAVYKLIARSNMPKAEEFQDWVFEEVLPLIRKGGMYVDESHKKIRHLNKIIRSLETKSIASFIIYAKQKGFDFDEESIYKELTNMANLVSYIKTGERETASSIQLILCLISESIIRDVIRSAIRNKFSPEVVIDMCKYELFLARKKILECLLDEKDKGKLKYAYYDDGIDIEVKIEEATSKVKFNGLTITFRNGYDNICA